MDYKAEVIDPNAVVSKLGAEVCLASKENCKAVVVANPNRTGFRLATLWRWIDAVLELMLQDKLFQVMSTDGSGGKPIFWTTLNSPEHTFDAPAEIIGMPADDFSRKGMFPAVLTNDLNLQTVTSKNVTHIQAMFQGFEVFLRQAGLWCCNGETAVMKYSITSPWLTGAKDEIAFTWGATCIGLAAPELLITGEHSESKMPIVGFYQPGYGCNGGSYLIKLLYNRFGGNGVALRQNEEVMEFVRRIAAPTICYSPIISRLVGWNEDGTIGTPQAEITGIAHITGGGVWEKLGEILPPGVGADLSNMPDPDEALLTAQEWSQDMKDVKPLSDWAGYSTFSGGCRMMVVCRDANAASTVIQAALDHGVRAMVIGETTENDNNLITIHSRFRERGKILRSDQPE